MKKNYFLLPVLLHCIFCFGQLKNQNGIDKAIRKIEKNQRLKVKEYKRADLLGIDYGDGTIKVWSHARDIVKIEEHTHFPYGLSIELVYFENGLPIKIVEIEENFKKTKDGFDKSRLEEVFRTEIYVLGKAKSKIENYYITKEELGQRFFTRKNEFSDYLEPYQMAQTIFDDH